MSDEEILAALERFGKQDPLIHKALIELGKRLKVYAAERDALLRLLVVPGPSGYRPGWFARLLGYLGDGPFFDTRAEAIAAVRKAAGLDERKD